MPTRFIQVSMTTGSPQRPHIDSVIHTQHTDTWQIHGQIYSLQTCTHTHRQTHTNTDTVHTVYRELLKCISGFMYYTPVSLPTCLSFLSVCYLSVCLLPVCPSCMSVQYVCPFSLSVCMPFLSVCLFGIETFFIY